MSDQGSKRRMLCIQVLCALRKRKVKMELFKKTYELEGQLKALRAELNKTTQSLFLDEGDLDPLCKVFLEENRRTIFRGSGNYKVFIITNSYKFMVQGSTFCGDNLTGRFNYMVMKFPFTEPNIKQIRLRKIDKIEGAEISISNSSAHTYPPESFANFNTFYLSARFNDLSLINKYSDTMFGEIEDSSDSECSDSEYDTDVEVDED